MKFYKCDVCGKIIGMVKETPTETICCGKPMRPLIAGETDGAKEKHVPVMVSHNHLVTVQVGSIAHPMTKEHYIEWIALETECGNQRKVLHPGDVPSATFALTPGDKVKRIFAYCNLHGLWQG